MARIVKRSPAPLYALALVWVIWALFFPLYSLVHFLAAAASSLAVFAVAKRIWKDRVIVVPDAQRPPEPAPAPKGTGNPELDALMADRDKAAREMRRLDENIEDEKISAQIVRLEELTQKIIGVVVGDPRKLKQIRKFMNYYLPTTLKLLNAYDRMDAAGVSGANIDGAMGKIETMMDTVVTAFSRQLDALFADEALDIGADITVMEQMLAQEGIGGMQMPM